jgi:ATP-dependent protease ClpP protease subunit
MFEKFKDRIETIASGDSIIIHIKSHGGDLESARKVSNLITQIKHNHTIMCVGFGEVHSAALHIFIAGTYRRTYTHTRFLLHSPLSDGSLEGNRDYDRAFKEEVNYFTDMLGVSPLMIEKLMKEGVYLNADQAHYLNITNYFKIDKKSRFV